MKCKLYLYILLMLIVVGCVKDNRWDVEIQPEKVELEIVNISEEFFDTQIPLQKVRHKYPFFFNDEQHDTIWENQRTNKFELMIFDSVQKVYGQLGFKDDLGRLFARYQHYFPTQAKPKVFVYSSGAQSLYDPVIYSSKEALLFIALDGFLGKNNQVYMEEKVFPYLAQNMNPENMMPTIVQSIGNDIIRFDPRQQTFVDLMVDEGKKLILADALLPKTEDNLKIGYSKEKYNWAKANEGNIWNYFVEQNYVFSDDRSLKERFIMLAPFSKFLNDVESDSPGRIGIWIGWQICKAYLDKNEEMTLEEFLQKDTQTIFKESKYKPKKGNGEYVPLEKTSNDEVKNYD